VTCRAAAGGRERSRPRGRGISREPRTTNPDCKIADIPRPRPPHLRTADTLASQADHSGLIASLRASLHLAALRGSDRGGGLAQPCRARALEAATAADSIKPRL